jgi:hypothetical protein
MAPDDTSYRRANHEALQSHPSRRGEDAAPQDEEKFG